MTWIDLSEAHRRAGDRLLAAQGSVREAFAGLGLGWTYDDVEAYLLGSPSYEAMLKKLGGDQHGRLQGLIIGFAIVAVEQARLIGPSVTSEGER
jgi:hypothetical protein